MGGVPKIDFRIRVNCERGKGNVKGGREGGRNLLDPKLNRQVLDHRGTLELGRKIASVPKTRRQCGRGGKKHARRGSGHENLLIVDWG